MTEINKDERIAELEAKVRELQTAFIDAVCILFAEVNEHAKHHLEEMAERGVTMEMQMEAQAKFLHEAMANNLTAHQIIHHVADHYGHTPLPSESQGLITEVFTHILEPGETVESTLRKALDNGELPDEVLELMRTLIDSGQVDQIDARIRDERAKSNAENN